MNLQKKKGCLELISGPMFAGKSTEILRRLLIDESIGFKVVYINHSADTRSSGPFSTHNPLYKSELTHRNITFLASDSLSKLSEDIRKFDIIGVDEAQFFTDLIEVIPKWVEQFDKRVIVAGLTGDSQRRKFGQLLDLEPLADKFDKLSSYCLSCAKSKEREITKAIFTHRVIKSNGQVKVGGSESYMPVCRRCYIRLNSNE